jgi:hypothetical protein
VKAGIAKPRAAESGLCFDVGDFDGEVGLAVALFAAVVCALAEADDVDLFAFDWTDDFGCDCGPIEVWQADFGIAFAFTGHEDAIEYETGSLLGLSMIDLEEIAFGDFDLGSAVFDDGVHGIGSA